MHTAILQALGCVAYVTNGAGARIACCARHGISTIRGLRSRFSRLRHIFDIGRPVTVGGMEVRPGDLLHGDRHGVLNRPASKLHRVSRQLQIDCSGQSERVIDFCRSAIFPSLNWAKFEGSALRKWMGIGEGQFDD